MFWLRLVYTRLYGLLRKNRVEREMEDEMRFHLRRPFSTAMKNDRLSVSGEAGIRADCK